MAALGQFTSIFTRTGVNMSAGPNARRENRELFQSAPFWARKLKPLIILHHRLRRLCGGMYFQEPFQYALYTQKTPGQRTIYKAEHPTFLAKQPES
jgi:hypothetical protein